MYDRSGSRNTKEEVYCGHIFTLAAPLSASQIRHRQLNKDNEQSASTRRNYGCSSRNAVVRKPASELKLISRPTASKEAVRVGDDMDVLDESSSAGACASAGTQHVSADSGSKVQY